MNREHIYGLIMKHFVMLEKAVAMSSKMLITVDTQSINKLNEEIDNRQRLINLMLYLQEQILDLAQPEDKEILVLWNHDLNTQINIINSIDSKINYLLDEMKNETSIEIGSMFKNKQKIQGYNHSNTKKY